MKAKKVFCIVLALCMMSVSALAATVNYYYEENGEPVATEEYDAEGVAEVSLKPVVSSHSIRGTKVACERGYFKGWAYNGDILTAEYKGKTTAEVDLSSGSVDLVARWYQPENVGISGAKAQRIVLSDGRKAIRFLALVGDSKYGKLEELSRVGFVISDIAENPTVEAGYQYTYGHGIYSRIKTEEVILDMRMSEDLENIFGFSGGRGIIFTVLPVAENKIGKTYYATPYIECVDGTRVYGITRAISYQELLDLDNN